MHERKMKAFYLLFCLSVTVCVCVAVPITTCSSANLRNRRETCEEAVAKLSQDQVALACQALLSPIVIGNLGATPEMVTEYCTDSRHCSAILVPLFDEIGRLCGGQFPQLETTVRDECYFFQSTYCGDYFISMFDNTTQPTYDKCVEDYYSGKGCTDNCKTITSYIQDNRGCCYTDWQLFNTAIDPSAKLVDKCVFEECQLTMDDICTEP
ncbi:hypothetical protein GBAR_LOCUS30081 [Geodia barretti]|uniref:DUF19 domain-containing protein n=1 Tax=Geodia barretti TaxID=519541 RepID=A0AA35TWL5_GEOBA|nr:hypothetical protein GBAR_LOCUS30081 [Geodia barretti]